MSSHEYILYDPDGRGLLIAVTYRILKNNDIAGWYYGYTGNGEYRQSYFQIVRNAALEPIRYLAGSTAREWERDYLLEKPQLEASIFVVEEVVQLLEEIKSTFVDYWLKVDERSGEYRLSDDRLRKMQLEEDDSYSCARNADWQLLGFIASRWNLLTPLPDDPPGQQGEQS